MISDRKTSKTSRQLADEIRRSRGLIQGVATRCFRQVDSRNGNSVGGGRVKSASARSGFAAASRPHNRQISDPHVRAPTPFGRAELRSWFWKTASEPGKIRGVWHDIARGSAHRPRAPNRPGGGVRFVRPHQMARAATQRPLLREDLSGLDPPRPIPLIWSFMSQCRATLRSCAVSSSSASVASPFP